MAENQTSKMGKGDASARKKGRKTPPQPSAKPSEAEQEAVLGGVQSEDASEMASKPEEAQSGNDGALSAKGGEMAPKSRDAGKEGAPDEESAEGTPEMTAKFQHAQPNSASEQGQEIPPSPPAKPSDAGQEGVPEQGPAEGAPEAAAETQEPPSEDVAVSRGGEEAVPLQENACAAFDLEATLKPEDTQRESYIEWRSSKKMPGLSKFCRRWYLAARGRVIAPFLNFLMRCIRKVKDGLMTGDGEGTAALQEDACSTLDPDVSPKSENAQSGNDGALSAKGGDMAPKSQDEPLDAGQEGVPEQGSAEGAPEAAAETQEPPSEDVVLSWGGEEAVPTQENACAAFDLEAISKSQDVPSGKNLNWLLALGEEIFELEVKKETHLPLLYFVWSFNVWKVAQDMRKYMGKWLEPGLCGWLLNHIGLDFFQRLGHEISASLIAEGLDATPVFEVNRAVIPWLQWMEKTSKDIPWTALRGQSPPSMVQVPKEYDPDDLHHKESKVGALIYAWRKRIESKEQKKTQTQGKNTDHKRAKNKAGRYPVHPDRKALVRVLLEEGVSSPAQILAILQQYEDECNFKTSPFPDLRKMNRDTICNDIVYLKQNKEIRDKKDGLIRDNCVTIKEFKTWLETRDK